VDAVREIALVKAALAALAVVDLVAADVVVDWVADLGLHQIRIILGWKTRLNPCKLPCKASQNDWMQ
jgi:hypothetical protein